jgi:hypothetical protein
LPVDRKKFAGKVKNFAGEGKNSSYDLTKTGENICGVLQTRFAMPVSKPILAFFSYSFLSLGLLSVHPRRLCRHLNCLRQGSPSFRKPSRPRAKPLLSGPQQFMRRHYN